jgi:hypothetical protein
VGLCGLEAAALIAVAAMGLLCPLPVGSKHTVRFAPEHMARHKPTSALRATARDNDTREFAPIAGRVPALHQRHQMSDEEADE